jgi:uncharacterized protein YndB with AHSA1/START domain
MSTIDLTPNGATYPFERSHSIVIAATPDAVFGYVTNPKSWPEWLPSSHEIDCDNRPMGFGDTFHEHWRPAPARSASTGW